MVRRCKLCGGNDSVDYGYCVGCRTQLQAQMLKAHQLKQDWRTYADPDTRRHIEQMLRGMERARFEAIPGGKPRRKDTRW